ncbi:hypothetical protein LJC11_04470 [Bacteroidales bacterium OttesenSCG-928-I21]|nr:hypothetical protein [Bacteroidales bacterium OttesenSCG-928-I21]
MKKNVLINLVLLLSACFVTITGCKEEKELPSVSTKDVKTITQISAVVSCNVSDNGGTAVFSRGVCWSKENSEPTKDFSLSNIGKEGYMTEGLGVGSYTCKITPLVPNTKYYVRAYATNSEGTSYGETREFTTEALALSGDVPVVTTNADPSSEITSTKVTWGGTITDNGGTAILAKGICWSSENSNPTVGFNISDLGKEGFAVSNTEDNTFTCDAQILLPGKKYYIRAYATNAKGTGYGEVREFTTSTIVIGK